MSQLNSEQQQVITNLTGPVQVLAGAGAGKTTTLMHRVGALIEAGVRPEHILLVTFTKKAAAEIKERLVARIGEDGKLVNAGTFHSICLTKILKRHADEEFLATMGLGKNWESIDETDQAKLMRQTMNELTDADRAYCDENQWRAKNFESFLSMVRSMGIRRTHYYTEKKRVINNVELDNPLYRINDFLSGEGIDDIAGFEQIAMNFWERYEQLCRSKNAIDFDDILSISAFLMEDRPEVAKRLAEDWRYLMLDEYQDTNTVQMKVMDAIAQHHQNICVVGDDQQSIYAFRGSNIGVIRGFQERYPNAKILNLTINYRSSSEILTTANRLAGQMPNRLSEAFLKSPEYKSGKMPRLYGFRNDQEEADYICEQIIERIQQGKKPDDIAVLYRNRSIKTKIEQTLINRDVPYVLYGDTSFFDRKEVKDAISMIRFVFRPWSGLAALRFVDGSNLPVSQDIVNRNAENMKISPYQYMIHYASGARDVYGNALDEPETRYTRLLPQMMQIRDNIRHLSQNEEEAAAHLPQLKEQMEAINQRLVKMLDDVDSEYYPTGSVRKGDVNAAGVAIRKAIKFASRGSGELNQEDWHTIETFVTDSILTIRKAVDKSNVMRLTTELMEGIKEVASICDDPMATPQMLRHIPDRLRDMLAGFWETHMQSALEGYTKSRTASDNDQDGMIGRLRNVEYVLDRFTDRLIDGIEQALADQEKRQQLEKEDREQEIDEEQELCLTEVLDLALDDLVTLIDKSPEETEEPKVQLMTMHASKGLEFDDVFVAGAINDLMPGPNPEENPAQAEEELRLLYVATTRAKQSLDITYPVERTSWDGEPKKCKPSIFLKPVLGTVEYKAAPKDAAPQKNKGYGQNNRGYRQNNRRQGYSMNK